MDTRFLFYADVPAQHVAKGLAEALHGFFGGGVYLSTGALSFTLHCLLHHAGCYSGSSVDLAA